MSWSRSLSGTRLAVLAAIAQTAQDVESSDTGQSKPVAREHQTQIAVCYNAVHAMPLDATVSGSISGHAYEDGPNVSGSLSMSLTYYAQHAAR